MSARPIGLCALLVIMACSAHEIEKTGVSGATRNFDTTAAGSLPAGLTASGGEWKVVDVAATPQVTEGQGR